MNYQKLVPVYAATSNRNTLPGRVGFSVSHDRTQQLHSQEQMMLQKAFLICI